MTDAPDLNNPATVAQLAATFRGAAMADAEYWFMHCAHIKLTEGGPPVVGVTPTEVQRAMFEHNRQCLAAGVPCKMLVYKSRRMGASTGAQGIIYHRLQKNGGLMAKLLANKDETAGEVSDIFKRMATKDRFPWPGVKGPAVVKDLAGSTTLASGSIYKDLSARGEEPGRGGDAQIANITEAPFYPLTGDPISGFLQSLKAAHTSASGLIIADFTPNGPSGWAFTMVMAAVEREAKGQQALSDWKLIFVPWWKGHDSFKPFANDAQRADFIETITPDEREEWENHDPDRRIITLEHMHWRRSMIANFLEGSVAKFRSEYPSSVREGFMQSARHCFNLREMQRAHEAARGCKPIKIGGMSLLDGNEKAVFIPDDNGVTKIWDDPCYGMSHIVIWDTMTGADQAGGGKEAKPDWHSIGVWRAEYTEKGVLYPPRRVAGHHSQLPIELAAAEAHALSIYYGGCLIVPEVNNSGLAGVKCLEFLGARIFQRKVANITLNNTESANGWMTTPTTRKTIVDFMEQAIRKRMLDVPEVEFWAECLNFVIDPKKGRPEALSGQHDDRVLEGCIALANMSSASVMEWPKRQRVSESQLRRNGGLVLPDGTRLESYNRDARR